MNQKRKYKTYSKEFKEEAVSLVTDQGYSVAEAAEAVGVNPNQIYNWKKQQEEQANGLESIQKVLFSIVTVAPSTPVKS